ncbi:uncharacterized protein DEA37_0009068 [Paragonimus westermani]|uniref:Uncharacterized protein n=1 Tax=Paragonimus westermani TaxID=34504 RepID=A0A5J4NTR6_9TREM|nr:uncharacterized protein DEA37_0009068 [Paragonimus westermani]
MPDAVVVDSRLKSLQSAMIGSIFSSMLLAFYTIVGLGEVNAADIVLAYNNPLRYPDKKNLDHAIMVIVSIFQLVPIKYEQMDSSYYPIHLWYAYGDPPASPFRFTISDKRSHAYSTLNRRRSNFDSLVFRKQPHFDPIMFRKSSDVSPQSTEEESTAVNKLYKQ